MATNRRSDFQPLPEAAKKNRSAGINPAAGARGISAHLRAIVLERRIGRTYHPAVFVRAAALNPSLRSSLPLAPFLFAVAATLAPYQIANAQQTPELAAAERLIREGRAAEALRRLVADEEAHAGEPDFDYLLGLAALEADDPALATLALERVLAQVVSEPQHAARAVA